MRATSLRGPLRYSPLSEQEGTPPQGALGSHKPAPAALTRMRGATNIVQHIDDQNKGKTGISAKFHWTLMKANLHKAKSAGVDATKKSFWSKALGATVGALALAALISLAVSTGGGAVVAAAAIAGVVFAISVADAGCAYRNLQNAKAHAAGQALPYNLPMGSSSIGNLMHWSFTAMGASADKAKIMATIGDGVLRIGMGAAASVCTSGTSIVINSFEHIAPMVAAASTILQTVVDFTHNRSTSKVYVESVDDIDSSAVMIIDLLKMVEVDSPEDRAILENAQNDVRADAERTKALVPDMRLTAAVAVPTLALTGAALAGIDLSFLGGSSGPRAYGTHSGGGADGISPQQAKSPAANP